MARTTRQNRLSHMRKLLELLTIADEDYKRHYQVIKSFLKVPSRDGDLQRPERQKRALSPHEATGLLYVWQDDTSDMGLWNNALIRLLIYTGLRRSEVVALKWTDINLEDMTLTVRHGKGDKKRVVAIVDPSTRTQDALVELREVQGDAYTYVFPKMTHGRRPSFAGDKPCTDKTVDRVVKSTADQAGHVNASTTLHYAQATDSVKRRDRITFRFA